MANLYIGLMSGTSLDCIDAVIVDISQSGILLVNSINYPLEDTLRADIEQLMQPGSNEIDRMGRADRAFSINQAKAVKQLLTDSALQADDICAIGSHGQTIRHRPMSNNTPAEQAFTLQIGCPSTLAFETGITTVADFRRKDIAAGGQGAPLAPMFHQQMLGDHSSGAVICNIGGMSNPTIITNQSIVGFDSGPGNVLMDIWINRCQGLNYDDNGDWAKSGNVLDHLLKQMLTEDYFQRSIPKSTGRELFNMAWLQAKLALLANEHKAEDIQRTLLELTAVTIADSISAFKEPTETLYLCGGGAHNGLLKQRLSALLPRHTVTTTADLGIDADWVEACAFAWLAHQAMHRNTANARSITGASRTAILGGIYYS